MKPELSSAADPMAPFREAVEIAARNLGLVTEPPALSPEHWQRVLTAVEARMRMRGAALPAGWREDLAEQMGRGADACAGPES